MKFRKWLMVFIVSLMTTTLLLCAFNYIVDPFGVFGDKVLKWYSYDMVNNPRVAKIAYLDQFHDRYDSYVIGGSKSSSLSPALLNDYYKDANFYSMMMYGGDFYDYEKTLYYLIDHYTVKNIILHMSLHEISHYQLKTNDLKQQLHAKVTGESLLGFYLKYLTLNPQYSLSKLEGYAKRSVDSFEYSQIKPTDGVYNKSRKDAEEIHNLEKYLKVNPAFFEPLTKLSSGAIDQNVASLKRMKAYCEERGITFRFVTGATYQAEMERYNLNDLKNYWRKLSQVTDLWSFSGYSAISLDPRNFYDPTHYRNHVGQMMLAYMFGDQTVSVPNNFGHHTTKDNVEAYVERAFSPPQTIDGREASQELLEAKRIPILTYHHLEADESKINTVTNTPQKFKADLMALKEAGYETVFLDELKDYVMDKKELPQKPVMIMFDDGYLSNYTYAYPILKELDMKATISMVGWSVGRTLHKDGQREIIPHFTWAQAKEMYQTGHIDLQNHTYDMHEMGQMAGDRRGVLQKKDEADDVYEKAFTSDVLKMQEQIESHIGNQVIALTYPLGEFTKKTEDMLLRLGYQVTVTTKEGVSRITKGDPKSLFALMRINASYTLPSQELLKKLADE